MCCKELDDNCSCSFALVSIGNNSGSVEGDLYMSDLGWQAVDTNEAEGSYLLIGNHNRNYQENHFGD